MTNKNFRFAKQIALHTWRQAMLNQLTGGIAPNKSRNKKPPARTGSTTLQLGADETEQLLPAAASAHYQVSKDQRHHTDLRQFLYENRYDPACQVGEHAR